MNIKYIYPHVKTDLYQAHINAMHHKQKYEIPPSSSAYAIYQKYVFWKGSTQKTL